MRREGTDQLPGSLQGAAHEGERRQAGVRQTGVRQGGMQAVGVAAARLAAPIVAKRGGGTLARLKLGWAEIVGAELAAVTWPEALGRDAALKLRVAPGVGLELQHRAPLVIERINLFFGRAVVVRLALIQAPLPLPARLRPAEPEPLASEETAALDSSLDRIGDPELRAALAALGRLVLADRRRR